MKELNDFLTAKGSSTDLRVKRTLAQAFGLPMDNGTEEQQSDLLRALKVGCMAIHGTIVESFKVEVAFREEENRDFDTLPLAKDYEKAMRNTINTVCRISQVTTISSVI